MDTAFIAEAGLGKPIIAFLGEYDALPGLSQEAGVTTRSPIVEGHRVTAVVITCQYGAMAAAMALNRYMEDNNIPVRLPLLRLSCGRGRWR